jgi:hypothetical protein
MIIEADVGGDGVLTAKVPDRYKGKRVRISIREIEGEAPSQWAQISKVLDGLEVLDIPRRSEREILEEHRLFRES